MIDKTTIYHSTLQQAGEVEVTVMNEAFKSKFQDKYGKDQYSVKLTSEGKDHYYTTTNKQVADYLGSFKGKTIKISAGEQHQIIVSGDDAAPKGKVTSDEVKQKFTKKPAAAKEDYWSRKEERDIEWAKHQAEMQPKIMRQSARKDAVAFHALEVQSGKQEPSMERVEEIMKQMEKWVNEQEGTEW